MAQRRESSFLSLYFLILSMSVSQFVCSCSASNAPPAFRFYGLPEVISSFAGRWRLSAADVHPAGPPAGSIPHWCSPDLPANQLLEIRLVADVPFAIRVCLSPLFCGDAEQGHIQHICLVRISKALTLRSNVWRKQHILYCIGMNPIIDFLQCLVEIPAKSKPAILIRF